MNQAGLTWADLNINMLSININLMVPGGWMEGNRVPGGWMDDKLKICVNLVRFQWRFCVFCVQMIDGPFSKLDPIQSILSIC